MKSAKSTKVSDAGPPPDDFRTHALAAASLLARESAPSVRQARPHVLQARGAARDGTAPDRAFATVLHDWWRGRRGAALAGFVKLVADVPADADVALWASHLACTEGNNAALLLVASSLATARPDLPLAHGLQAFALSQAGRVEEALESARHALAMDADQPIAQMVMADDFSRRGDAAAGVAFLVRHRSGWRSRFWRNALLASLARLQLRTGDAADALDIFDTNLLPAARADAPALQGAISFLWRAEMQGVDVGDRWHKIGDMVQARWHEHILPLPDLHFVFALARDGREQAVRAFLASMERVGEADNSGLWQSLVIPLARGLVRLADGDEAPPASVMEPVLARLHLLGGCRQDREVIELAFDRARVRARPTRLSVLRPVEMQVAP